MKAEKNPTNFCFFLDFERKESRKDVAKKNSGRQKETENKNLSELPHSGDFFLKFTYLIKINAHTFVINYRKTVFCSRFCKNNFLFAVQLISGKLYKLFTHIE